METQCPYIDKTCQSFFPQITSAIFPLSKGQSPRISTRQPPPAHSPSPPRRSSATTSTPHPHLVFVTRPFLSPQSSQLALDKSINIPIHHRRNVARLHPSPEINDFLIGLKYVRTNLTPKSHITLFTICSRNLRRRLVHLDLLKLRLKHSHRRHSARFDKPPPTHSEDAESARPSPPC